MKRTRKSPLISSQSLSLLTAPSFELKRVESTLRSVIESTPARHPPLPWQPVLHFSNIRLNCVNGPSSSFIKLLTKMRLSLNATVIDWSNRDSNRSRDQSKPLELFQPANS